jgi:signal transduction histidine kinase
VDRNRLDSVNRGPKKEGEMLLRYFPVHVLMPEEGAIFWGVAKIGIETSSLTNLLLLQSQEQDRIRRTIWLEIILSLSVAGLLALGLLSLWARRLTEPLRELGAVTRALPAVRPRDFTLWLQNLERVDPQEQSEAADIRNSLLRLGNAIPRLGRHLLSAERLASASKSAGRVLPACRRWLERLRTLAASGPEAEAERQRLLGNLTTTLDDLARFSAPRETAWQLVDLAPSLMSAWRLATLAAPAGVRFLQNLEPLPKVWGHPRDLDHALLALVEAAGDVLEPDGELALRAVTRPGGGIAISLEASGPAFSLEHCQQLLTPFQAAGDVQKHLGPALAAAVAEQHGGSLEITPRVAGGLAFTLELPQAPEAHEAFDPYI